MTEFKPDNRKVTYRLLNQEKRTAPEIVFSLTSLKWIHALIEAHTGEVGFYAIVDEPAENTYYIREIFYPKHDEANGATCEISAEGETKIMEWLIEKGREDDIPKLKFWGHVHSSFTQPSGQDEDQAIELMNRRQSYVIRAICMMGEISITFFDYVNQIRFDNIKWTIEDGVSSSAVNHKLGKIKELVDNVSEDAGLDTLIDIAKVMKEDQELQEIEQKIKKLKEINIPKYTSHHHYGRYDGGYQQNLFPSGTGNSKYFQHRLTDRTGDKEDPNDILNEEELASLMVDVEKKITDFNNINAG